MLGRSYDNENCSAARTLEIVGERWSLLILRDAYFRGSTRFSEFQRKLGIAPNILANRLERFVEAGLMETHRYSDQHDHHEYVLTAKGLDLEPVIIALTAWGDRWAAPHGPPMVYEHQDCGGRIHQQLSCTACDVVPGPADVTARPGPGFLDAQRTGSPARR
jgi:DNA-binding HxlR family transcriptional regulator